MSDIIYKDIPGYEGIYQATSNGEIYALPRIWVSYRNGVQSRNGYFVSKSIIKGYVYTKLTNAKSIRKTLLIHRLIAMTFIDKIEGKEYVNHINGIKVDNRIENLEWCTHKENCQHRDRTGLGNIQTAINSTKIKVIDNKTGYIYESMTEAAMNNGISRRLLGMMMDGTRKNKTNCSKL